MPRETLQMLAADVERLLLGGGAAAAGDAGLRQWAEALRQLGRRVPALLAIAAAVERVVAAPAGQGLPPLLDLLLIVRQVRAYLATAGVLVALTPLPPSGPWESGLPAADLGPLLDALLRRRWEVEQLFPAAWRSGRAADLRLVEPVVVHGLRWGEGTFLTFLLDRVLPGFGPAVVGDLRRHLDIHGKRSDGHRLRALVQLDPVAGVEACRQVLREGAAALGFDAADLLFQTTPRAEAIPVLIEGLQNKAVRKSAVGVLRRCGQAAVEPLTAALTDLDARVRQAAAEALEGIGRQAAPAVPALLRLLQDRSGTLRGQVIDTLRNTGDKPAELVPAFIACLRDRRADNRVRAADALQQLGTKASAAVPALLDSLDDSEATVRDRVAEALRALIKKSGPPQRLFDAVQHASSRVRAAAFGVLGACDGSRVTVCTAAVAALHDQETEVRLAALDCLQEIGAPQTAQPALVAALHDGDEDIRQAAVRALGRAYPLAAAVVPALVAALKDRSGEVREAVLETLAELGPMARAAAPALLKMLGKRDADVRCEALRTLRQLLLPASTMLPHLLRFLADRKADDLRVCAAEGLEELGTAAGPALPGLLAAARVLWRDLFKPVSEALANLGEKAVSAVAVLVTAFEQASDSYVRCLAARALGRIGPAAAAAVPSLLKVVEETDDGGWVEHDAALALLLIGGADELAVERLLAGCTDSPNFSEDVMDGLRSMRRRPEAALPRSREALRDEDELARVVAAAVLVRSGREVENVVPVLVDLVNEKQRPTSKWSGDELAARVLGWCGEHGRAGLPALRQALASRSNALRFEAARALVELGQPVADALPVLKATLTEWATEEMGSGALRTLEQIGEPARAILIEARRHWESEVRAGANRALARLS
jgi:HEAT repeat protein